MLDVVRNPVFQMPLHRFPSGLEVIWMKDIRHGRQPDAKLLITIAEQLFEAGRVEDVIRLQIPVPDSIVRAAQRELKTLITDSQRFFSGCGPRCFGIRRSPFLAQTTGHTAEVSNHAPQFILRFDGRRVVTAPVVGHDQIGHITHSVHRPNDGQTEADSQVDGNRNRQQCEAQEQVTTKRRRCGATSHQAIERIHTFGQQRERVTHRSMIQLFDLSAGGHVLRATHHGAHGAFRRSE